MLRNMHKQAGARAARDAHGLRKLAEAPDTLNKWKRTLSPGDILVASIAPKQVPSSILYPLPYLVENVFREATQKLQKGKFTHSALYIGGGNVAEIRAGSKATVRPLEDSFAGLEVKAVRPRASAKVRRKAVQKALGYVDRGARYSYQSALEAGLATVLPVDAEAAKKAIRKDEIICSNMITSAYPTVSFSDKKYKELLLPSDFLKSKKVRQMSTYTLSAPRLT